MEKQVGFCYTFCVIGREALTFLQDMVGRRKRRPQEFSMVISDI